MELKDIGERLKLARKTLNITQKDMSKMCGIPTSTVSEMESGIKKPHPSYLYLLSKDFNVNINWILTGKSSMLLPDFEIKWDFGQDNKRIMEMIYLIENSEIARHDILGYFARFRSSNKELVENTLLKLNKE